MTCIFEHDKKDMVFMRIKKKKNYQGKRPKPWDPVSISLQKCTGIHRLELNRDTSLPQGSRHGHAHCCTVFRAFQTKETTPFLVLLQSLHHRFHFIIFKKVAKLSTFWAMFFKVRHLLLSCACWVEISITYRSLQSQGLLLRLIYNNTWHDLGVLHDLC